MAMAIVTIMAMMPGRILLSAAMTMALLSAAAPAAALDLNAFRAANGRAPLQARSTLMAAAATHARDMARREHLDHSGFRERLGSITSMAAENVSYGCGDQACAIRQWSRSKGHRANMLLRGVTGYGIASAVSASGRRYWVLTLGN
jgi:uncharacterized protein YkwD